MEDLKNIKFSIVTPSYNQGKYLEKTILSVLEQDYPNLEYIIIDGGSTDNSVEIIKKYEKYLAYWVSEKDRGQSHAINKGFARAGGDLFGWLNSDDFYVPGALKAVAEIYQANPTVGAIVGAGDMVDQEGNVLYHIEPFDVTVSSLYRWIDRFFWQPSCFFSRQAWEKCGPVDESLHFAMDLDLWLKIAKAFEYAKIDAMLSTSLMHENAKTRAYGALTRLDAAIVILKHGGEKEARQYLLDYMTEQDRYIVEQDQRIEFLEGRIQDFLNSYSWKVTSPLRKITGQMLSKRRKIFPSTASGNTSTDQYHVQMKHRPQENRLKIVHALENFMTGGSSRLIVDIFEHLGHFYEQEVLTKLNPDPPNYVGVPVHDFDENVFAKAFEYFKIFKPDIVHVHFWEELSGNWYDEIFKAAQKFGTIVIENVNTPVKPYFSAFVDHYVYVSNYVLKTFGRPDGKSSVIYPGSNFELFNRSNLAEVTDNCIGMVYRLEPDKLFESSIDVFIKTVQRRPGTKVLIVGGGTFLNHYKNKVKEAGLMDSFEFTGYVPYETLPELYARMSIFVAPVWKESFGQVSPFAMNMGVPVVAYNIGALGEIIANRDLLAPPKDSARLTDIIIDLLDNREKRIAIGMENRKRAQSLFSVEAMIEGYAGLYKKLLEEKS